MAKICIICNGDCSNEPRFKNEDGHYLHQSCHVTEGKASNQQSVQPNKNVARHSLKLSWFHYCEFCDRPVKADEYLKWTYWTINGEPSLHGNPSDTRRASATTIHSCKKCGKRVSTINFHHYYTTVTAFLVAIVLFPPWTWPSIQSFSEVLLVIGVYAAAWFLWRLLSFGLRVRKRRFMDILNRWTLTHGANPSAWPTQGRDWVNEHGNNPYDWPRPIQNYT